MIRKFFTIFYYDIKIHSKLLLEFLKTTFTKYFTIAININNKAISNQ